MRELGISLADIRLWRDGVVSRDELIVKRLHTMDDDSVKTQNCRRVCEALLRVDDEATALSHDFTFCEEETTEPAPDAPLLLGIDIGTTSLSAQIVELSSGRTVQTYSFDHNAAINIEGYPDAYAQCGKKIPTGYGILTYYALRTLNLLPRKLQKLLLSWTC